MSAQSNRRASSGPCTSRRVLIVVGDPRVRSALSEFLGASDGLCPEAVAATARTALQSGDWIDVALVDVLLPELEDGLSVIRALAVDGRPVVALGASAAARAASIAAGATEFLERDSHPDLLLAALYRSAL